MSARTFSHIHQDLSQQPASQSCFAKPALPPLFLCTPSPRHPIHLPHNMLRPCARPHLTPQLESQLGSPEALLRVVATAVFAAGSKSCSHVYVLIERYSSLLQQQVEAVGQEAGQELLLEVLGDMYCQMPTRLHIALSRWDWHNSTLGMGDELIEGHRGTGGGGQGHSGTGAGGRDTAQGFDSSAVCCTQGDEWGERG